MTSNRTDVRTDDGSVTVLALAAVCVLALLAPLAQSVGGWIIAGRRAQVAADLSALAAASQLGVGDPCGAAARVALANRSQLVTCTPDEASVLVTVAVDPVGMAPTQVVRSRAGWQSGPTDLPLGQYELQ